MVLNFEGGFCSFSNPTLRLIRCKLPSQLDFLSTYDDIRISVYADSLIPTDFQPAYCINIYGPKKTADDIGEKFGDQKLYLQTPTLLHPAVQYYNPQYLTRDPQGFTPCIGTQPGHSTLHGVNCIHGTADPASFFEFADESSSSGTKLIIKA
ncbi:uncharacterized protein PV06_11546 [Exophiala oligosperma]|uniref:Uncharacterized protein n=1 Tax=Exophiala oligosperma TaxID=215243 RepID=A0A0D2A755_9EURO|nr:uncharacterized protein PV06_11546 [Exophiala oligosperma]KIW36156.1 hypothetical protein PV06_11546 [Exophiala oligosperma]